jgi:hypothetical protein
MGGWVGGWVDGLMEVKAVLRIAYSNKKPDNSPVFNALIPFLMI